MIAEVLPIATMQAVIAVVRGNPKSIKSLDDLTRKDVKLIQANPEASAIGMLTRKALEAIDRWKAIDEATEGYRTTVIDVANDIQIQAARCLELFMTRSFTPIRILKRSRSMN